MEGKMMEWKYNDGGRSKYFKGKDAGDCVTRAIAIAANIDYKEVYDYIYKVTGETPRNGVNKKHIRGIMEHFGGRWVPCMTVGSGCKVHLREDELPKGRIVCNCSGHDVAVIDGVIHDTHDPSRGGARCVYGYYVFPSPKEPFTAYMIEYTLKNGDRRWFWKRGKDKAVELLRDEFERQRKGGCPITDYSVTEVEVNPIANVKLDF